MGRIAEALKKAHRERAEKLQLGLGEASVLRESLCGIAPAAVEEVPIISRAEPSARIETSPAEKSASPKSPEATTRPGLRSLMPAFSRTVFENGGAVLGPLPAWDVHPAIIAARDRESSITEQYRAVRTWLLRRSGTTEHMCLAITSTLPREGKSVTTANLATVLAEVRHLKILVVDADFRQGRIAALLKLPNSPGLADVIAGRAMLDEAIRSTPLGNLSVLPAGAYQDLNPAELVNSTTTARVFEEIRERYHFTLVDTPPVQRLSDTGVIGALCTGILMVVRMNKTPMHLAKRSVHWLQANNLNVVGCIAACCDAEQGRSGYRESDRDD